MVLNDSCKFCHFFAMKKIFDGENSNGLVIFHQSRFVLDERILITLFLVISILVLRLQLKGIAKYPSGY